jgi:hypothetical protein
MIRVFALICLYGALGAFQPSPDRYFKEDHLTGATYLRLAADGTYTVTGREHMGVWIFESGLWEQSGDTITFVPEDRRKERYDGTEVTHNRHKFLAFKTDAAVGSVVPAEETKRRLDSDPSVLPPYVFFEIGKAAYERETKETYPFRTRRRSGDRDTRRKRMADVEAVLGALICGSVVGRHE